jgi:heat shock protein HslJ
MRASIRRRAAPAALPLAILVALLVGACDAAVPPPGEGSPAPSAAAFAGPVWTALSIRGLAVPPGTPVQVSFTADEVNGTGPCNSFGGRYRFDTGSGRIAFDEMAATARGCVDENRTAIDVAFFGAISRADRAFLDPDGRLHLTGPGGEVILAKLVEG